MSNGYTAFIAQLDNAIAAFPSLDRVVVDGKKILKGILSVIDKNGRHWEDYSVEIHASENFPSEFPLLFEILDKIPKIGDWHIYEDSLSCCVKVKPEEIIRCKAGITVTDYIQEEVLPYLFNQTHRRVEGYYINGEYSHGTKGIYEFYADILATGNDIKQTIKLMQFIAINDRPNRTSSCFCGNKIKFRHCHRDAYDKLKLIDKEVLQLHAYNIAKATGLYC